MTVAVEIQMLTQTIEPVFEFAIFIPIAPAREPVTVVMIVTMIVSPMPATPTVLVMMPMAILMTITLGKIRLIVTDERCNSDRPVEQLVVGMMLVVDR
tara:strand:- start:145 stop:438 length:294 start_codon:yes stop_codon:yes gene_type:complete